jgi:hypothetical protein
LSDLERKHGEARSKEFPLFSEGVYGKADSAYQKLMRRQKARQLPIATDLSDIGKQLLQGSNLFLKIAQKI